MNTQSIKKALITAAACAVVLAAPAPASAQESGAEVWARACGRCHRIQPPNRYDARHWEAIVGHMALTARLTSDEEAAVREFLMGAARSLAVREAEEGPVPLGQLASLDPGIVAALILPDDAAANFQKQCVACHGVSATGDGPAAVAFNPRPADLTDPNTVGSRTDDELLKVLTEGRGGMPSFSAILTPAELREMVVFIRSLSDPGEGRTP